MNRMLLSPIAGFLATFVAATVIAIAMRPLVSPMFGAYVRTDEDGLAFGPLIFGYFVIAVVLAWLVRNVRTGMHAWKHGASVGALLGLAVFLGDHSVTAGWSKIPAQPMLLSGFLDTFAVIIGGIATALVQGQSKAIQT